ncbi:MAG: hypothetical protein KAH48_12710 [Chlorobi bacterium]|nr:hypothetical protein [Chlorobiota bacterium]
MKYYILIIVLLFSTQLNYAGSDYHWVKMNFPDVEVTMIANFESDLYAVSVENELYHFNMYTDNKDTWEVVETGIEARITCVSPRFLGTDKGLYFIDHYDLTFDKIDEFENMNISGVFYRPLVSQFLFIETDMGLFSQTFDGAIKKCTRPDGKKIGDIVEGSSSRILGLTTSGELFYSRDTCQTWTKAVENPEGHKFTAIEEHSYWEPGWF